jgi:phage shock protein PspC (stress-responsive transcriptional regulator)
MSEPKRLYRHSAEGQIAGVCVGLAEYLGTDVTFIRLAWIVLSIVPGCIVGGIVAYLAAWMVVPDSSAPVTEPPGARRLTRSTADRKIAGVCGGMASYFIVDSTVVRVAWIVLTVVPGAILFGVIAYVVAWIAMPSDKAPHALVASSTA